MAIKPLEEEEEEDKMMIFNREELMIRPTGRIPTLRNAHFLKPLLNPTIQTFPKPTFLPVSSNPNIIQNLSKWVLFMGNPKPQVAWKNWVETLQKTHQNIWKKVGIFDAIKASTYHSKKDYELIIELGHKWCPEFNTFSFSWGECTITLEDVMILGGFPVLGVSVLTLSQSRSFDEIESNLVHSCTEIRSISNNLVTHIQWMKYFQGRGDHLEHVAFLVLWLSRYVFSTNSYNCIAPNVFAIAISLANGTKIALAHAVLASIYRDLSLLKAKIVTLLSKDQNDGSRLVVSAPFLLVQVWAWERFTRLGPSPNFLARGEPRLARWHGVKKSKAGGLRLQDVDSVGGDFLWRPYALNLKNWEIPKFYCDQEAWVLVNSATDEQLMSFARCLMACDMVGVDCMELYVPHRVGMQFGYDQDIPNSIFSLDANLELTLSSYEKPLDGLKFYIPPRWLEGDVTVKYYDWWRTAFSRQDHEPLLVHERQRRSLGKVVNVSEVLLCSSCSCDEAMVLASTDSRRETLNKNPPSFQEVKVQNPSTMHNKSKHVEEDKENEVSKKSKLNMDEESKHLKRVYLQNDSLVEDQETLSREEPLLGTEMNNIRFTSTEDEYAKADNPIADINLANTSVDASLIMSDEDDNGGLEENFHSQGEGPLVEDKFEYNAKEGDKKKGVNYTVNSLSISDNPLGKDKFEFNAMEEDKKKLANESNSNDMGTCSIDETLKDDNGTLSGEFAEDVQVQQHKAVEDKDTKQMKSSLDHGTVIVSEDENADRNPFPALCLDFETRINKLEKIVYALKAAKNRSMVR